MKRNLVLSLAFTSMVLGFQNCGPSNGFYALEISGSSSLSSKDPNGPPDNPQNLPVCGDTLAPGESCVIPVQFAPRAKGIRVGSLKIPSSDGTTLGEVALSGEGK